MRVSSRWLFVGLQTNYSEQRQNGDVVLDSFNILYRDEDSILDQIYEKQLFSAFYHEDLKF